jgi:hypothetical protein
MPSLSSAPLIRSVRHSLFSRDMVTISSRTSRLRWRRPPGERDFQHQNRRRPCRCQRTTVSGVMIARCLRQPAQHWRASTQRSLSQMRSRTPRGRPHIFPTRRVSCRDHPACRHRSDRRGDRARHGSGGRHCVSGAIGSPSTAWTASKTVQSAHRHASTTPTSRLDSWCWPARNHPRLICPPWPRGCVTSGWTRCGSTVSLTKPRLNELRWLWNYADRGPPPDRAATLR